MTRARELAELGSVYDNSALSNRNILMNGAQVISQRGTSALTASSSSDTFITDRFRISNYSDATFTGQQVADAPTDFEYSCKVTTTGTDTSLAASQYQRFITAIEGYNMNHLMYGSSSAKTCTLTFHVKSSLTGAFYVFGFNSAANRSIVVGYTIDSADTWEKKTLTIAGDTSGTWLTTNGAGMYFGWSLGSGTNFHTTTTDAFQAGFKMAKSDQVNLAGTSSATWQITGVQLEVGTEATPFEHEPYSVTLSKAQRYFCQIENNTGAQHYLSTLQAYSSSNVFGQVANYPATMRTTPSVAQSGTFLYTLASSSSAGGATTIGLFAANSTGWWTGGWGGGSGLTAGHASIVNWANGAKLTADAEL